MRSGFSLIEVMIAAAMMSGTAMLMATMAKQTAVQNSTQLARTNLDNEINAWRAILGDNAKCLAALTSLEHTMVLPGVSGHFPLTAAITSTASYTYTTGITTTGLSLTVSGSLGSGNTQITGLQILGIGKPYLGGTVGLLSTPGVSVTYNGFQVQTIATALRISTGPPTATVTGTVAPAGSMSINRDIGLILSFDNTGTIRACTTSIDQRTMCSELGGAIDTATGLCTKWPEISAKSLAIGSAAIPRSDNAGVLTVAGPTTLSSTLTVTGNENVGGTLGVTGLTTLGALNAAVTSLSSTLTVTGATNLASALNVTGATNLNSGVTANGAQINGGLTVGVAETHYTTNLHGALYVDDGATLGSLSVGTTASIGGTLQVGGVTTLKSLLNMYTTTTEPISCTNGSMYYNATSKAVRVCIDATWQSLATPSASSTYTYARCVGTTGYSSTDNEGVSGGMGFRDMSCTGTTTIYNSAYNSSIWMSEGVWAISLMFAEGTNATFWLAGPSRSCTSTQNSSLGLVYMHGHSGQQNSNADYSWTGYLTSGQYRFCSGGNYNPGYFHLDVTRIQ